MNYVNDSDRRLFLGSVGKTGVGLAMASAVTGVTLAQSKKEGKEKEEKQEEVGPTEDLMREHGILNRVLLIYDHFILRIDQKQDFKPELVTTAAKAIRSFVEDYHERQEEKFLFPRFEKAGVLIDLVTVLRSQHQAGRNLTDQIVSLANVKDTQSHEKLAHALRQFVRMYRPHEAREDTVLFPGLRKIISPHEFGALGEQFENNEHKQFGADGFELYRDKVANIEKQLGLYDLAEFTPGSKANQ
jgi:hemerythrin-like domain-containing protein